MTITVPIRITDSGREPDLPAGVGYTNAVYHDDGTVTVTVPDSYVTPEQQAEAAALRLASRLAVTPMLPEEALTEAEIATLAPLYDEWEPDAAYAVGDVARYADDAGPPLWECRQAHTSQAGWEPPNVLALWQRYRGSDTPGEVPEWATATPYAVGDEVTYQGQTYRCLQAHTSQPGWTPPAVPSLWTLIS